MHSHRLIRIYYSLKGFSLFINSLAFGCHLACNLFTVPPHDKLPQSPRHACVAGGPSQAVQEAAVAHEGRRAQVQASAEPARPAADGAHLRHQCWTLPQYYAV